jgi:hypothetical protein
MTSTANRIQLPSMPRLPILWRLEVQVHSGVWQVVYTTYDTKDAWETFHDIRSKGHTVRFS